MAYSSITKPGLHFKPVAFTGNASAGHAITGVGFQPDWVWIKNRDATGYHFLTDAIRGVTKTLYSNVNNAETTEATGLTAFGTDGFTVGSHGNINTNGNNIVSWNWKAGGSASSNSNGSITSSVSANTTTGFSIVSYTGTGANATVGHGLGAVPKMFIVKRRDGADSWYIFNSNLGSNDAYIVLDSTNASSTSNGSTLWNSTAPTNQVFSLGTNGVVNGSGRTYVAYCFSEKVGYSKFGSYTGNGNADGTFIYTGFKPAWLMYKITSGADNWQMLDNKRNSFNTMDKNLFANLNNVETTSSNYNIDFLSNGFKVRNSHSSINGSGSTYIYMAFAESPFVNSNGVPTNAR